jgi:hypothetical protein
MRGARGFIIARRIPDLDISRVERQIDARSAGPATEKSTSRRARPAWRNYHLRPLR